MSERPDVSVIVPARNAAATITTTLEALARQEFEGHYEVIVVDNGSTDKTGEIVTAFGANLVDGSSVVGAGEARNLGALHAQGRVLAFTDADCLPTPHWLAAGTEALSGRDVIQGAVEPDPGYPLGPFSRSLSVKGEALYETANIFMRRDLFERLGGFLYPVPADSGRPFGEDVQLGWRAKRMGARTAFSSTALVHHLVFDRGPREFIREHGRLGYFAPLAREVPELREAFFFRRYFLSRRTAEFDLATLGILGAIFLRPRLSRMPLGVAVGICIAPYTRRMFRDALPHRRAAPTVAVVRAIADARGAASLVRHSVRSRTLVI